MTAFFTVMKPEKTQPAQERNLFFFFLSSSSSHLQPAPPTKPHRIVTAGMKRKIKTHI